MGELSAEERGVEEGVARLPVMAASHEAIQRACSPEVRDVDVTTHFFAVCDTSLCCDPFLSLLTPQLSLYLLIGWIEGRCFRLLARAHQSREKVIDHKSTKGLESNQ